MTADLALQVEHESQQPIVACTILRGTLALIAGQSFSSMCIVPVLTKCLVHSLGQYMGQL